MMHNPLLDSDFLKELVEQRERTVYARIEMLSIQEEPEEEVFGRVTQGLWSRQRCYGTGFGFEFICPHQMQLVRLRPIGMARLPGRLQFFAIPVDQAVPRRICGVRRQFDRQARGICISGLADSTDELHCSTSGGKSLRKRKWTKGDICNSTDSASGLFPYTPCSFCCRGGR